MGKEYPQMKREYQQIVISKLKVICHKHWHAVDWKETWPWRVVCVYFEWCNVWGGSLLLYKLPVRWEVLTWTLHPVKVLMVSHTILPLCLKQEDTEIFCSNDISVHIAQCNHSLAWNKIDNNQQMRNVQKWDWSERVIVRHGIDEQTVHWEHEKPVGQCGLTDRFHCA